MSRSEEDSETQERLVEFIERIAGDAAYECWRSTWKTASIE